MVVKPALRIENASYQIADHRILSKVSLDVTQGQVFGLLGPNGAGKSSLLNGIAGLKTLSGDIYWRDQALNSLSPQTRAKQLAVVHQVNEPIFSLTTEQVVKMGLLPHKSWFARETKRDKKVISDALSVVGLTQKASQIFNHLSGGEQQRCLIARALVQQSPLLILDEPVNHLDIFYQHQILALLHRLAKQQGKTIIVSLHDLNLAASYCDNIALLHKGEVAALGTPDEVLTTQLIEQVFQVACDIRKGAGDGRLKIDFYANGEVDTSSAWDAEL